VNLADIPFNPFRGALYSSQELIAGIDRNNPSSFRDTLDFRIFHFFVTNGRATPRDALASVVEALHDNAISQAVMRFLSPSTRIGAIMGGHDLSRCDPVYAHAVAIAKGLTERGFLLASGGGPGAMEATHLGATLRGKTDADVKHALAHLAACPELPASSKMIRTDGTVDEDIIRQLHAWIVPAYELAMEVRDPGQSLAVPTWHYGHEPFTPLATHVAKYFQNSIREDGLLAIATHGIVYMPGSAGTLQEVFQDAAQNFYHSFGDVFSPMVFFDFDGFWSHKLPIKPLLRALFVDNNTKPRYADRKTDFENRVCFTDDVAEAIDFLDRHELDDKIVKARWSQG